ncbi:MAG: type II secretion system F family protein [Candidatus Eremiobacteraeota bacterium]|nr:type II secretion system F family protein [Candidatus Eremiobacteraeota bacterium]
MPVFHYEALDTKGRVVQGKMQAQSVESVIEELRNVHYTVTNIKEKKDYLSTLKDLVIKYQGVSLYALAIFTRQFATIFNAGLPIIRGLDGLAHQSLSKKLQIVIRQIHDDVKNGSSLTRAMQKHATVFSPVYIALVRAGEMAGALGEILERLAELLEREYSLRKKVQTAMTYPIFIFVAAVAVIFLLVNYIFPQFVNLLEGMDIAMPWPTTLLIYITTICRDPIVIFLFIVIAGVAGFLFKQYFQTPLGRRQLDRLLIELPIIGKVNNNVAVSRFCRTLGTLLNSGVPMVHALDVVGKVSGNEVISDIVDEIKMSLKSGMRLSQPMRAYKIFPPMVTQMIAVGEETGNLPDILTKLANAYDSEVETSLDVLVALVEPIMIVVMGGVVMFVLIAVFLPIYSILQKF